MFEEIEKYLQDLESKIKNLEKRVSDLENSEEIIIIDCKELDWDTEKFVKSQSTNKTIYKLAVKNSKNKKVYFKSDYQDWTEGDLIFDNTGKCENVYFKVETCETPIWGCVQTFPSNTIKKEEFEIEKLDKTIQLQVFQECLNNDGVYFRAEVLLPDNNTNSYTFELKDTGGKSDARVEKISHNEWVIRSHENQNNGYFKLTVKRQDCKDCVYESYSTTCNHDNYPTNCEENQRKINIIGGQKILTVGDIFEINSSGNILDCLVNYYNTNVEQISDTKFKVTGLPFKLHYQPNCKNNCHGWTELYQQQ